VSADPLISIEIEQALLGAVLLDSGILDIVDGKVISGDPIHQRLFESFVTAHSAGCRIDPRLAQLALGTDGSVLITPELTFNQYVARLAGEAIGTRHAADYARTIRDLADRRRLLEVADRIKAVAAGSQPVTDIAVEAIENLDAVSASRSSPHVARVSMGTAAEQFVDDMTVAIQNPGRITGTTTGLTDLDAKTGGFRRGELVIIGGRPGWARAHWPYRAPGKRLLPAALEFISAWI
jgi:replicative DNA helicase